MERWLTEAGRLVLCAVIVNISYAVIKNPELAIGSVAIGIGFPGLIFFLGYMPYIALYHRAQPTVLAIVSIFYNVVVYPFCEVAGVEKYPIINAGLFSLIILLELIKQIIKK